MSASDSLRKLEPEAAAALVEADEAVASCAGDVRPALRAAFIANTYLEAGNTAIDGNLNALGAGRMRMAAHRVKKI